MVVTWWAELKHLQFLELSGQCFQHHGLAYGHNTTAGHTPLLLLHGFLGDKLSWQYCLAPFSRHAQVFSIDLPGHGQNSHMWPDCMNGMIDWLEDAMNALGIGRCHLIAHSLGAWIALHAAVRLSERIASLSMIACAGLDQQLNWSLLRKALALKSKDDAIDFAKALTGESGEITQKLAQRHLEQLDDKRRRSRWMAMLDEMMNCASTAYTQPVPWQAIKTPLKFLWSRNDTIVPLPPPSVFPANSDISLHDVGGHIPHILAAGWLTHEVSHFIDLCATPSA